MTANQSVTNMNFIAQQEVGAHLFQSVSPSSGFIVDLHQPLWRGGGAHALNFKDNFLHEFVTPRHHPRIYSVLTVLAV